MPVEEDEVDAGRQIARERLVGIAGANFYRERGMPLLLALFAEAAPSLSTQKRASLAELYVAVLSGVGKHVSEHARSRAEVDAWAATVAEMFLAYLSSHKRR